MRKPSFLTKLAYGSGQAVISALDTTHLYYFVPFFSIALGVPGSLVGLAAFVGILIDAMADPLMGHFSDQYRSRYWGRRHFFMLVGAPFVAIFLYLLFNPPDNLDTTGIFIWLIILSTLCRLAVTVNYIPYLSLGAELSSDYDERTSIANYRNFFGYALGTTMSFFLWVVFIHPSPKHPTGWTDPEAFGKFGALAAGIAFVGALVAFFGTFKRIPDLPKPPMDQDRRPWHAAYSDMLKAMRLRSFRGAAGGWFAFMALNGTHAALITTVNGYYWGLTSSQQFLSVAAYILATLPGSLLAGFLCRRFQKRTAALVGVVGFVVVHTALYALDFAGLLPARGTTELVTIMIGMLTLSLVFMVSLFVTVFSMKADVTDDLQLSSGRRQEGVVFATSSFGQKLTSGLGGLVAGVGLDVIRFPKQAEASVIPPDVLHNLGLLMGLSIPVIGIIPIAFFWGYRLNRSRLVEIQDKLRTLAANQA